MAVTLRESTGNDPSKLRKARGAMLLVEGTVHHAPRVEMDVVDPIGAGDAFDAGLIAARLLEKSWDAALRWGVASSALKLAVAGDFGHATPADIDRLLINDTLQGTL